MNARSKRLYRMATIGLALLLGACAAPVPNATAALGADAYPLLNRLTWGASSSAMDQLQQQGWPKFLDTQLHPPVRPLPAELQSQIDAMTISKTPLVELVQQLEQRRRDADAIALDEDKKAARQAYQQELNRLQREAATRHLLRALYSPNQVQEQMNWFWMNHFSVHQGKGNLRAMLGDYESMPSVATRWGIFAICWGRWPRTRPCCAIWTTSKTPPGTSTKITPVN